MTTLHKSDDSHLRYTTLGRDDKVGVVAFVTCCHRE
jgi:hypothetical protein